MIFFTERLHIRNYKPEDAEACYENWGHDESSGRYICNYPVESLETMQKVVDGYSENGYCWLVCLDDGTPIGDITFTRSNTSTDIVEVGYIIGERYQGNGYAKEALECMFRRYFTAENIYMIQATCNIRNNVSIHLLESFGFRQDAVLKKRFLCADTGEREDCIVFSLTSGKFITKFGNKQLG